MDSLNLIVPSPIQELHLPVFDAYGITVFVKRDDLIHPSISGNKWRKLKFNVEKFKQKKYDAILTFGGAFSNHIAATAYTGNLFDIPTIGIIRGEELTANSNATLTEAARNGMTLDFVSREQYRERYERFYWEKLRLKYGNVLIIEEGGANFLGLLGCSEIVSELPIRPDFLITASGTGTTAAGLLYASNESTVISVPVFKNGGFIKQEIADLLMYTGLSDIEVNEKLDALEIEPRFHFGGYGKWTNELVDFMNSFYSETAIPLDQIYTGKMMFSFFQMLKEGRFLRGSKIVLLHTGGLQGTASIQNKLQFS